MSRKIVAKFGGTSLADAGQFRKVKNIIMSNPDRRIVVASAPGKRFKDDIKVTDLLIRCYRSAASGKDFESDLKLIADRFDAIIKELEIDFELDSEINKIREHLKGSPDHDYTESRGEYLNSRILAKYLDFTFVDPAWAVCFTEDGLYDADLTQRTMAAALKPLDYAVVAGFYGSDKNGRIHTFPRGGSDITGSIAAKAVCADLYENWTDVSGLLAADPSIVENPKTVEYLTFHELRTLSYMGASVLHADSVLPALKQGIPINIRNTNRPDDAGTMIVNRLPENRERAVITGVAGRRGMCVIQVEKMKVSDEAGFTADILEILKDMGVPFEQCLTGIDTVSLVIRNDLFEPRRAEILNTIRERLDPDTLVVKENLSMIAVVGEDKPSSDDATIRILSAVANAGVLIRTINQGAGDLNLIIGVKNDFYETAVRAIYSAIEQ